jgi:hypothetical protein
MDREADKEGNGTGLYLSFPLSRRDLQERRVPRDAEA